MKTSDVLRKAGDVLRERGWCQFEYRSADGAVCAYGALAEVDAPSGSAEHVLRDMVPDGHVAHWNDAPGRTAAEVMIALDAAYVVALQEEGVEPGDVL